MSPREKQRPGPIGQEVIAIIRSKMGRQRLTQADVVRSTGIVQSTLSRLLSGASVMDLDQLDLIAHMLGTTAGAILDEAAAESRRNPDLYDLAADENAAPTDRERFDAAHDHDDPA